MNDTTTEYGPLTLTDANSLAAILHAAQQGRRVEWLLNGDDSAFRTVDGVARCFAHNGGGLWFDSDGDIRGSYLHVSGTFEYWLPMTDVIA